MPASISGKAKKFKKLLKRLKERRSYYSNILGDIALDAEDYEKAGRYFKEAYLIEENQEDMVKIEKLIETLKKDTNIHPGFKERLYKSLLAFKKGVIKG